MTDDDFQDELPDMPRPRDSIKRQRRRWLEGFLGSHFPDKAKLDRKATFDLAAGEFPPRLFPEMTVLVKAWLTPNLANAIKAQGYAFPDEPRVLGDDVGKAVKTIVYQWTLPLEEFRNLELGKLVRARADIARVQRDFREYALQNPDQVIDVDAEVAGLKRQAGLG